MSIPRLLAISAIFMFATLAWFALGTSIVARTGEFDARLGQRWPSSGAASTARSRPGPGSNARGRSPTR